MQELIFDHVARKLIIVVKAGSILINPYNRLCDLMERRGYRVELVFALRT